MSGGDSMLWEAGSDITAFEQSMRAVCNIYLAGKIGLVERCWPGVSLACVPILPAASEDTHFLYCKFPWLRWLKF